MHEMGIASSVLEAARKETEGHPGARLTRIGVRIGAWCGVDPESLRFCFEALAAEEDEPSPPIIEIENVPRQNRCPACDKVFAVEAYEIRCPGCGAEETLAVSGDELELAFIELEEA
jgi:hydrogenase nickel incorporation protein HypA/HybF